MQRTTHQQARFPSFGNIPFLRICELLLILFLSLSIYIENYEPIESWLVSHWLFDYQNGFTKRGLVGEILRSVQHEISYRQIELIGFTLGLVLSLQVAYLAFIVYRRARNPLVPVLILLAPFAIPEVALEGARFDTINYIIALSFLLLPRRLQSVPLAAAISILMLLIHEASLFIQLPLVWVAASYDEKTLNVRRLCVLISLSVVATGVILAFSHINLTEQEFLAYLDGKLHPIGNTLTKEHFAGYYVLFVSAMFNIQKSFLLLSSIKGIIGIFTVAIFIFSWLKLSHAIPKYLNLTTANAQLLLFAAGSSPIVLVCLGVDWYRWCALMTINALAITAFLARQEMSAADPRKDDDAGKCGFRPSTTFAIFFLGIFCTQFPAWYPGEVKDGIQCLAADYKILKPPVRTVCPSQDFPEPKS